MNLHDYGCYGALKCKWIVHFPFPAAQRHGGQAGQHGRAAAAGLLRRGRWGRVGECDVVWWVTNTAGCVLEKKIALCVPTFSFVLDERELKLLSCVHCGCADRLWLLCRPGWLEEEGGGDGGGGRGWGVAPSSLSERKGPIRMPGFCDGASGPPSSNGHHLRITAQWRLHNEGLHWESRTPQRSLTSARVTWPAEAL